MWVALAGNNGGSVAEVSPQGTILANPGLGTYSNPYAVAIDAAGDIWVTGTTTPLPNPPPNGFCCAGDPHESVTKLGPDGTVLNNVLLLGGTLGTSEWIAIDAQGNTWVAGGNNAIATALSSSGSVVRTTSVPGGVAGGYPTGLAIDAAGHVWVTNTDLGGYPVAELDSSGKIVGEYADASFVGALEMIAIDRQGNVWIAGYSGNNLVEMVGAAHGPQYFPYAGPVFPL